MILSQVRELSEGKEWSYEVKRDGYLCLAGKDGGVTLWSHRGTLFTARFPEVARACEKLPPERVVDGEVVANDLTRMAVLRSGPFPRREETDARRTRFEIGYSGPADC